MRIKSTIKNGIYALVSYGTLAVLALLVRKVFLISLPMEFLGYEGLFGNVFALLALADLGIESVILYRMFPAFANNDETEINRLMSIYKILYGFVGALILLIGLTLTPFLKYIITGNKLSWDYVYVIYFVQLVSTLCTYFLAYKRLMFTVSQQEYICTKVDTVTSIVFNFIKILILVIFKNYILYLLCNLAINLISNIIISIKVKKEFSFLSDHTKVTYKELKEMGVSNDIKHNLVQKVCGTIYGGTDNIVISALLGIGQVGLLANYTLIQGYVTNFITKILKPFQMSIGNYIYSNDKNKGLRMFRMFDLISFFFACTISVCYLCLFNPFITLWLGGRYLLQYEFVFAFAANQYILWNHQFLTFYRYSFGKFELDKIPIAFAAIVNVVLSIILSKPFGVAGVMLGTAVGQVGFWIGRVIVVYSEYIAESILKYAVRQIIRLLICGIEMIFCYVICNHLPLSLIGIALRIILCVFITTVVNFLLFFKSSEMKSIMEYLKKVNSVMKSRGEK